MSVNNQSSANDEAQSSVDVTPTSNVSQADMGPNDAARRMAQQMLGDDEDENGSQIPNGLTKEQFATMKNQGLDPNTTLAGNGLSSDVAQTNEMQSNNQTGQTQQSETGATQNNQQMTTEYQKNPGYMGINGSDPIPANGGIQNQGNGGNGLRQQPQGPQGQLVQNGLVNEPENRTQQGPKGPQAQQQTQPQQGGLMQPGQSYLVTPLTPQQAQEFNHATMQTNTMEKASQTPNAGLEKGATKNKDQIMKKQDEQNKQFNVESGKNATKEEGLDM